MRRSAPAIAGVFVALTMVACTGAPGDAGSAATASAAGAGAAPTATPPSATAPAAALPSATASAAAPAGAMALTVGGDGPPGSLVGLQHADVVIEYPVAADRTGLFVLAGHGVDVLGPLRSATPSDASLALAFATDLATTRTTAAVVDELARADLTVFEEHTTPGTLVRDPARRAPFNLYAAPSRIGAVTGDRRPRAVALSDAAAGRGRHSGEVAVTVADDVVVTWTWDPAGRWLRTTGSRLERTVTGERVSARAVVVLEVPRADRPPVIADLVGAGPATVLHEGSAVAGRWARASDTAVPAIHGLDAEPGDGTLWLHVCAAPCASQPGAGAVPSASTSTSPR